MKERKVADLFGEQQVIQFIWIKGKGIMGDRISKIHWRQIREGLKVVSSPLCRSLGIPMNNPTAHHSYGTVAVF